MNFLKNVIVTEPLSFMDMIVLEQSARAILTDSGGIQKEAFFYGVPCITLRDETEWVELVEHGYNILTGADGDAILDGAEKMMQKSSDFSSKLYGDSKAGEKILDSLRNID